MKYLEKLKPYAPVSGAVLVALCMGISLSKYQAPVYAAETPKDEALAKEAAEGTAEGNQEEELEEIIKGEFDLADGVYQGIGTGYAGSITVAVTVKDRQIASIEVLKAEAEDQVFFNRAKSIIDRIMERQSLDVDTVSGATYSSRGILRAVKNALTGEKDDGRTVAAKEEPESEALEQVEETGSWKDGVYYGSGTGFGGQIKVAVTVRDGKIVSVEIQSAPGEGASYLSQAKAVIDRIIAQQSLNVDTVSGATYSSRGILRAVRNALPGATDDGKTGEEEEEKEEPEELDEIDEPDAWRDGTYTGSGKGFGGTIKVSVTVAQGKMSSIKILSHHDGSSFINKAKKVITRMISRQTTNVDTVSGATYSSQGIILAVRDALKKAGKATGDTTQPSVPTGKMPYPEGIYYGTGEGFQGDITVALIIQDETAKAILITQASDDDTFLSRAKEVAAKIVETQSVEVDLVSGATFSSRGILDAVKDALAKAQKAAEGGSKDPGNGDDPGGGDDPGSGDNPGGDDDPGNGDDPGSGDDPGGGDDPGDKDDKQGVVYTNGIYESSAVCFDLYGSDEYYDFDDYNLSVTVTVEADKIISVTNIKGDGDSGNTPYINRAANGTSKYPGIVKQIVEKGVPEGIDSVSGATCSSKAMIEACQNALEKAKIQPGGIGQ